MTENFIKFDYIDDDDKVLLWENDLQLKRVKKITIYDIAILSISQYRDNIVLWGFW